MSENSIEHNIDVLMLLGEAIAQTSTLDDGLRTIVRLTCQLMDTTQAAFLLADEEKQLFIVRAAVGLESSNFREGYPLVVPERLQNILWRLQSLHQINWIDSGIEGIHFPIITMPIYFKGARIGHLITGGARDPSHAKDPLRRKLLSLLAPFASLIIENGKATDLIRQRFVLNSRELLDDVRRESAETGGQNTPEDQLMVTAVRNPGKVVRLLAASFYRELSNSGFNDGHIAIAAAHLLEGIVEKGKKEPAEACREDKS
jgi:hypothetical protein